MDALNRTGQFQQKQRRELPEAIELMIISKAAIWQKEAELLILLGLIIAVQEATGT